MKLRINKHSFRKRKCYSVDPHLGLSFVSLQVTLFDRCWALKMTSGGLSRSQMLPPGWLLWNQWS